MPDYIYLLANRLSLSQQNALQAIREVAREANMTVFLTGGAVRDLTSGSPVRDLDVSVQGNALALKPQLKAAGAVLWGEHTPSKTLFARFPGSVRVEVSSTRSEEFPKPGKPVYHPGSILEDLRRRDFTANAMALSLNEGSYGLLMDPLNGVADLEARLLRLVSNYGFLDDPIRLVRAARLQARLGWELEEKTKVRYDNAKEENVAAQVSAYQQGYEAEEILHEENGLKVLKALEAAGWMKVLFPAWTSAKIDAESLDVLRDVLVQLQMQGVNPDPSAAQAQLLTAKLSSKDLDSLKKLFVRQGFIKEWESQEERAKEVGKRLTSKEAATPSAAWKLISSADPEAVLWLGMTSKSAAVQEKFKDFFSVWPEARQRIPYALMQEMRITPELEGYQELVKSIFFELIDGKLTTEEEIRQFLEPHSPPAPPPPVTIRRPRAKKSAARSVEARESDDEEQSHRRVQSDEDGEEIDEDLDPGDERGELVARSVPHLMPPHEPPVAPVPPPITSVVEQEAVLAAPTTPAVIEKAPAPKPSSPKTEPKTKHQPPASAPKSGAKAASLAKVASGVRAVSPAKAEISLVPRPSAKKAASAKPAARPPAKSVARPKERLKHAAKPKPPVKKAAGKPAKGKPQTVAAKPKVAKTAVKPRPAAGKPKPMVKAKPKAKTPVKPKKTVKAAAKAVPLKKKR